MDAHRILAADARLRQELEAKFHLAELVGGRNVAAALESVAAAAPPAVSGLEAIVLAYGRPVLFIRNNAIESPRSETWSERLEAARANLLRVIPSVGRVELRHHADYEWVGTAWLVRDDVLVTNRHVAVTFAMREKGRVVFRLNPEDQTIAAAVDFRHEHLEPEEETVEINEVLYLADESEADVAFLKLAARSGRIPIALAGSVDKGDVATIGYPARDGHRNPGPDMSRIFGDVYDVKRLAPGAITRTRRDVLEHDCTTLGGNSGSAVVSLATGEAVGLHFSGSFLHSNYAVPAPAVAQLLGGI